MTDEELNELRERYYEHPSSAEWAEIISRKRATYLEHYDDAPSIVAYLLPEVERLRALAHDEHVIGQAFVDRINELEQQNAAMREIVVAVARGEFDDSGWNNAAYCRCDPDLVENEETDQYEVVHQPDCMLTKARAILAAEQPLVDASGEPPAE